MNFPRNKKWYQMLSKFREPVSGLTHLGGAIAAVIGQIALLAVGWSGAAKIVSLLIYGFSMISLFSASAAYHLIKASPNIVQTLRKLDHSAIYLLIAGTYTPFCILAFKGFFQWGMLAIVWSFAMGGIFVKIFYVKAPRWLNATIYVAMGWLGLAAVGQIPSALPMSATIWLIVGGVIYTLGAIVYSTKIFNLIPGKFGFHEVWHIFVLLGATAHFISVMLMVVRPV
jgi:hemolysin III